MAKRRPVWLMHLSWGGTQLTDVVKSTLSGQDGSRENSVGGHSIVPAKDNGDGGLHRGRQWLWEEVAGFRVCSGFGDVKDTAGSFLVRVPG